MFSVRTARTEDLDTLLSFERGIISAERPFDITLKDDPIHYYDLAAMLATPHIEIVVAESGNEIVGSGYARIEDAKPYLKHATFAYLGFMYVKPDYRGLGINQLILESLKAWTLSKGISEMRLDVYDANEIAIRAYEKAGFSKYMTTMRMGLK